MSGIEKFKPQASPIPEGGGVTIGDVVSGGTPTEILYTDNSGNLYSDALFTRDSATKQTTIGADFTTLSGGFSNATGKLEIGLLAGGTLGGGVGMILTDPSDADLLVINRVTVGGDGKPDGGNSIAVNNNGVNLGGLSYGLHDSTDNDAYFNLTAQNVGTFRHTIEARKNLFRLRANGAEFMLEQSNNSLGLRLQTGSGATDYWRLPVTAGTSGYVLTSNGDGAMATWQPAAGGGSTPPGGSDTQIQFNNAGAFAGTPRFTYEQLTSKFKAENYFLPEISTPVFSGSGLNDMANSGLYSDITNRNYDIRIDGYVQTLTYTNLTGGTFTVSGTVTGSVSGAQGNITADDGTGEMTVLITNGIMFSASDVITDGSVTADYDTTTSVIDTFSWSDGDATAQFVQMTGLLQSLSYGVEIVFATPYGHTYQDEWIFSATLFKNSWITNNERNIIEGINTFSGSIYNDPGNQIYLSGLSENAEGQRPMPIMYSIDITNDRIANFQIFNQPTDSSVSLFGAVQTAGTSASYSLSSYAGAGTFSIQLENGSVFNLTDTVQRIGKSTDTHISVENLLFKFNDGIIRGDNFHNNPSVGDGNATQQDVRSGTYTPMLTNVTNITTSTAYKFQWMRVGNVVTVSGRVNIENTGTGASELGISLPIASDITASTDCVGSAPGSTSGILDDMGWIIGDATNNRAAMQSTALSTGAHDHWVSFTYEVI